MVSRRRPFLFVLIAFAFLGGTSVQLARSAGIASVVAGMPCDMMMAQGDAPQGAPMAPCKAMTPDCMKQLGCVADVALPTRLATVSPAVAWREVAYWPARFGLADFVADPEPLPPRTT